MSSGVADRFEAGRYAGDEPVHVFRADQYGPSDGGVWMPERIWDRLRLVGQAYELHLLSVLDGSTDPVFLSGPQVDQLLNEARFVGNVLDDPLVEAHVGALLDLAASPTEGASKDMFGIEFP